MATRHLLKPLPGYLKTSVKCSKANEKSKQNSRNYSFLSGLTFQKSPQNREPLYFESPKSSWWQTYEVTDEGKMCFRWKMMVHGMKCLMNICCSFISNEYLSPSVNRLHPLTQPTLSLHLNEGEDPDIKVLPPKRPTLPSCNLLGLAWALGFF